MVVCWIAKVAITTDRQEYTTSTMALSKGRFLPQRMTLLPLLQARVAPTNPLPNQRFPS